MTKIYLSTLVSGAAILLAASACSRQTDATSALAADQSCLFSSAEAYENLTEKSYTVDAQTLADLSAAAEKQARACLVNLTASDADALSIRLDAVQAALRSDDRAAVTRNAVEAYRIFVTAETREPNGVPLQVSLLDYAGFRMQADLQAAEPDWEDFENALSFAEQQWSEIETKIIDLELRESFAAELNHVRIAAKDRNTSAAKESAGAELDQVDLLEKYFSQL
jgi:hypothetical protein